MRRAPAHWSRATRAVSWACVARTEFEKAAGVAWTGRLPRKPVTVSVASLEPAASQVDRCVVVAETTQPSTLRLPHGWPQLAAAMDADSQERKALEKRHERCVKAQQELESFLAILEKGAWLKRVSRSK